MQERQIAEAVVQLIITHRQLGIDFVFLGEPGDARLFVAELVDELQADGLMAGEDAAVGDRLQCLVVEGRRACTRPLNQA